MEHKSKKDQTFLSFKDKWEKNTRLAFSETVTEGSDIFNWILSRNGFFSVAEFRKWLSGKKRILDAGCGNGRITALMKRYASPPAEIVAFDLSAADIARENLEGLDRVFVLQGDLLNDLSHLGYYDLIYCQEVLHHTLDPRGAFLNLCERLDASGEVAIYVYKKKAPLREYADDYIRERISVLSYEEALKGLQALTELGRALSELNTKVTVPDVHVLGIEAGEYEVQRLIYHFFLKCFWNASLSFQDNVAINYDWYHPQLCSRHTLGEVESWFADAGLHIVHRTVDFYGITVRGIKGGATLP